MGDRDLVKIIGSQALKQDDPNASTAAAAGASSTSPNPSASTTSSDNGPPQAPSAPAVGTAANAVPSAASATLTAGSQVPVATCHGVNWMEGETDCAIDGPFIAKTWKVTG